MKILCTRLRENSQIRPKVTIRTEKLQRIKLKSEEKYRSINMQIYPLTEPLQRWNSLLSSPPALHKPNTRPRDQTRHPQSRIEAIKLLDSSNSRDMEISEPKRKFSTPKPRHSSRRPQTPKKILISLQTQLSQAQLNYSKASMGPLPSNPQ